MQCPNCGIPNDADSKFCKECGSKLTQAASSEVLAPEQHMRIGELIYAAYKHKEAGKIEDSILACQGALALNEASAPAHSLLASLYELKGDTDAAVREYERAVELNPSAEGDRRKLEALKSGLMSPVSQPVRDDGYDRLRPYAPYAAAIALFFIVLVFGLMLFRSPASESNGEVQASQPTDAPGIHGNISQAPAQPYGQYQQGPTVQGYPPVAANQPLANRPLADANAPASGAPRNTTSSSRDTRSSDEAEMPAPEVKPLPAANSGSGASKDDTPVIVPVTEPTNNTSANTRRTVNVTPTPQPTPTNTIAVNTPPSAPVDPEQKAIDLQKAKKYDEAITAYRQALNRTTDSGRIYQQIARCYQQLSKHDMAIDNYTRAINSYKDQLAAGRDPGEVNMSIRACESGIDLSRAQSR